MFKDKTPQLNLQIRNVIKRKIKNSIKKQKKYLPHFNYKDVLELGKYIYQEFPKEKFEIE